MARAPRTRARGDRRPRPRPRSMLKDRAGSASSLTSALREEARDHEAPRATRRRREGHRADGARRDRGVPAGGCSAARAASSSRTGRGGRATGRSSSRRSRTYGDTIHTFVNRGRLCRPLQAGFQVAGPRERPCGRRRGPHEHRPHRRQRRARPDERLGRLLRTRLRNDRDDPLLRRGHLDRVLRADVEGDGGRRRARSSSRSTSRPKGSARARSRSTSSSTAAPARSTSRSRRRTSSEPWRR